MSTDEATTPCPYEWTGHIESTPMEVFLTAAVDHDTAIGWHRPGPNSSSIVIRIGGEQLTLEFFDEESLQRLRDVAEHAIPPLRAAIAENERLNDEFLHTWHAARSAEVWNGSDHHEAVSAST